MRPRVAFFTDCFLEVNGVALTSRKFAEFARSTGRPFLAVHPGPSRQLVTAGQYWDLSLENSSLSMGVDRDLSFDLRFHRHLEHVCSTVRDFQSDLIHITSPGHIGLLGAMAAHRLRLPLMASWHTNVHEFGARRLLQRLGFLPEATRMRISGWAGEAALRVVLRLYRRAELLFAPNPELVAMLQARTGLPCYLMERGIDVQTFSPHHRRVVTDDRFVIGFVGRLSAEKNVRLLAEIDRALRTSHPGDYQFLIVGDGSERAWLQSHLADAEFTGILRGQALAEAYARMDVFVFPSETDTYGNVIQEALASGVPCVVSARGGPKYLVRQGETGFVAAEVEDYARAAGWLINDRALLCQMRKNARRAAEGRTWEAVFEGVYTRYDEYLNPQTKHGEIVSPDVHQNYNSR